MQNENKDNKKDVFVTLVLTESTSSLLNLNLPHLEKIHPENSQICLITPSEFSYFKKKYQKSADNLKEASSAGSSRVVSTESKNIEEIYLKISSEVALFSTGHFSSSSCVDGKYKQLDIQFLNRFSWGKKSNEHFKKKK